VKRRGDKKPNYSSRDCGIRNSDFSIVGRKRKSARSRGRERTQIREGALREESHPMRKKIFEVQEER
jgi:hypothetical protein